MDRRSEDDHFGEGRPVEPEEARAHGNDPDAVRIHRRDDDAGTTRQGPERDIEGEEPGEARRVDHERAAADVTPGGPWAPEEERRTPTTSGVEESAMRLLEAFYDLSGGRPGEEVPLGRDGAPEGRGAAQEAGIDTDSVSGSVERDVAARYLLNQGYVAKKGAGAGPASYEVTASGIEQVRLMRGLAEPAPKKDGRSGMSEKMQTRLLSLLTVALFLVLNGRVKKFIDKQIPERRGIKDDLAEAALQGAARLTAVLAASVLVRQLAGRRR